MNNFCAEFLSHFNKKILDESGNLIISIKYDEPQYIYNYQEPFLLKDILQKKEIKTPLIKRIHEEELKNMGLVIIGIPLSRIEKWRGHQRRRITLAWKNNIPENAVKIRIPTTGGSAYHYAEHDLINKRVRIVGKDTSPNGVSEWINLEDDT